MRHWNPKCPKCGHPAFSHDKFYELIWDKKKLDVVKMSKVVIRCFERKACKCDLWATDIAKLILGKPL
jgi:hypothetical protein